MSILTASSAFLTADLRNFLRDYGLDDLASWAATTGGLSQDEFIIQFEEQPLVRERYAPVFERREAIRRGEASVPITMAQVLEAERADRQLEQEFGLPEGMIDTFDRLNADVSSNELRQRVQVAAEDAMAVYATPGGRQYLDAAFAENPALTDGGIVALYLDPDVALPKLKEGLAGARVSAGATASNFRLTVSEANELARQGFGEEDTRQAFGQLESLGELTESITGETGQGFTRADRLALASGDPSLRNRLEEVAARRTATFQGGGTFAGGTAGIG